jgi:hypothetical protein
MITLAFFAFSMDFRERGFSESQLQDRGGFFRIAGNKPADRAFIVQYVAPVFPLRMVSILLNFIPNL